MVRAAAIGHSSGTPCFGGTPLLDRTHHAMVYRIWTAVEPFILRAELLDRESIEETRTFLEAVLRENRRYRRSCLLINVSSSRPVFHVEQHGLIDCFRD